MKMLVSDPTQAARRYGGATWEPDVGWWTYVGPGVPVPPSARLAQVRDAIYLPSRDREAGPVRSDQVRFAH